MMDVPQIIKMVRKMSARLESGAPGIIERAAMSISATVAADKITEQAGEICKLRHALSNLLAVHDGDGGTQWPADDIARKALGETT